MERNISDMIVYQAHNKVTNKFYIGKTTKTLDRRMREHFNEAPLCRNNSIFHAAIRKYGPEHFDWVTIEKASTLEELNQKEKKWIALLKECKHKVYNLTGGGDGGGLKGEQHQRYGKKTDAATKIKISNTLKEYFKAHENPMKGRPCPTKGVPHTKEAREKISKAKKGKSRPDMVGVKNRSARAIVCETTKEYFEYAKLASIKYDDDLSSIIKCCKGKIKTVGGRIYKYYEPSVYGWIEI